MKILCNDIGSARGLATITHERMQTSHGSSASRSSSGISQIGVLSRRSTLATQRRMAGWLAAGCKRIKHKQGQRMTSLGKTSTSNACKAHNPLGAWQAVWVTSLHFKIDLYTIQKSLKCRSSKQTAKIIGLPNQAIYSLFNWSFQKHCGYKQLLIGINITRVYQRTFPHCLLPRSISVSMSISLLSVFGSDGVLMLKGIEDVGMVCNISCQRTSRAA